VTDLNRTEFVGSLEFCPGTTAYRDISRDHWVRWTVDSRNTQTLPHHHPFTYFLTPSWQYKKLISWWSHYTYLKTGSYCQVHVSAN